MIRPWPSQAIAAALRGRRSVGVIDQNLSLGSGGILYQEIAASIANMPDRPTCLRSFVGGLGGKDISRAEFEYVLRTLEESTKREGPAEPILLMTQAEREMVEQCLPIAGKTGEVAGL